MVWCGTTIRDSICSRVSPSAPLLFQNQLIFHAFTQKRDWRLILAPESCIASPTKIRIKMSQKPIFRLPENSASASCTKNIQKRRIHAHHVYHYVGKIQHYRIYPSCFSLCAYINLRTEMSVESSAGIKITHPTTLLGLQCVQLVDTS